jgi:hypothetical protein
MENKICLPRKDKLGNNYISYSQITTFKRSKQDYYNQYILDEPFTGNAYTEFGSKVGEALENNNFGLFSSSEADILKKAKRLDLFERKITINYEGFYVIGFVDTCSLDYLEIIDYKTGGKGKDSNYRYADYSQLQIYALGIRQETGITPQRGIVEFITRGGNAFIGEDLYVKDEPIKSIEVDLSYNRLKYTYWEVLRVVNEISNFYKLNK